MTPLGLHHLMATRPPLRARPVGRRAGRAPTGPRSTTTAPTRTASASTARRRGSNAVAQYAPPVARRGSRTCRPCRRQYLLWFHHVPWDYRMPRAARSGTSSCIRYTAASTGVRAMRSTWDALAARSTRSATRRSPTFLAIQEKEARWWRDACIAYFQTFSRRPLPPGFDPPQHALEEYKALTFPYAPGDPGHTSAPFRDQ